MLKKFLFLSPDGDGGAPGSTSQPSSASSGQPANTPPAGPQTADAINGPQTGRIEPAPGNPAARTVITGERSEREIELEAEIEGLRGRDELSAAEKKKLETKISELENELHDLKQATGAPTARTPAPRSDKRRRPTVGMFSIEED